MIIIIIHYYILLNGSVSQTPYSAKISSLISTFLCSPLALLSSLENRTFDSFSFLLLLSFLDYLHALHPTHNTSFQQSAPLRPHLLSNQYGLVILLPLCFGAASISLFPGHSRTSCLTEFQVLPCLTSYSPVTSIP